MEAPARIAGHDIVVVGASAGGVEALRTVASRLPRDLVASIFVVLHLPAGGTSVLPKILGRAGPMSAVHAQDGQRFEPGCIYIAPPDQHMRFADGSIRLDRGPKENGHRPAVDPLFRSAAETYGGRVTGVVLSGALDDGAAGLLAVAKGGGAALVQSSTDALYPAMPVAAFEVVQTAFVGTAEELAIQIIALAQTPPTGPFPNRPPDPPVEADHAAEVELSSTDRLRPAHPSGFTCPECHGRLWETADGGLPRLRCSTGHEFSNESVRVEQSEHVRRGLAVGLRALEERAATLRRLASRASANGHRTAARRFERKAADAGREAVSIHLLLDGVESAAQLFDEERVG